MLYHCSISATTFRRKILFSSITPSISPSQPFFGKTLFIITKQSTVSDGNEDYNGCHNPSYPNSNTSHCNLRDGNSPYHQFNVSYASSSTAAPYTMTRRGLCSSCSPFTKSSTFRVLKSLTASSK
jgi:hypothetical protein